MSHILRFVIAVLICSTPGTVLSQIVQGVITDPLTQKGTPNLTVAIGDCTAVTDSLGHYSINLGEVTSVQTFDNDSQELPKTFELFQNYPNPFNAETIIRYQLPESSHVSLKIFNLLGQEIKTLLDKKQQTGEYQIRWNGLDYLGNQASSGIYIMNFVAGSFVESRKILLLK